MTITRDQLSNLTATSPVAGTTFTITFPTNPTAGSSVIVALGLNFNAVGSVTSVVDNGTTPTTFTQDVTKVGTANHVSYIYRADNITLPSSGGYVITVTVSVTGISASAGAQSYLGKATGGPVSTNTGTATSATITTNNGTSTAGGSLFVGTFQNNSSNTADAVTVTNVNFTARLSESNGNTAQVYGFADQIKVANTADACTWSVATATDTYSSAIAVYSPAATQVASFTPPRQVQRGRAAASRSRLSVPPSPPASPPAARFSPPKTVVRGGKAAGRARNSSSLGLPAGVAPPPVVAPFRPPRTVVRGEPKTGKGRQNDSLRLPKPTIVPQPAALFAPPRNVVRGQRNPGKSHLGSSLGIPPAFVPPVQLSPFHQPTGVIRGRPAATRSRTSARAGSAAVVGPPVVSASGLVAAPVIDDFLVASLNPQWTSSGTATSGSNQLLLACTTAGSRISSVSQFDWTNTYSLCKMSPYTGNATGQSLLSLYSVLGVTEIDFGYSAGNLIFQFIIGGTKHTTVIGTYSATNHAWLRLRYDIGFVYYDTSANGLTWTNQGQFSYVTAGMSIWSMNLALQTFHAAGGTDGNSTFQYVNVNASLAGPVTIASITPTSVFTLRSSVPDVGPHAVSPANTQGNLLVVIATWNSLAWVGNVLMAAGAVADDQGNWWRYVGDSGQDINGIRTGMWICSNALAVRNWLSFCPQGYTGAFAFQVIEMTGLPASYYPKLDFHVDTGTGSTSVNLTGTTRTADYVFAAIGTQTQSPTVSGTPAGMASIATTRSGGSDATGDCTVQLDTFWGTFAANTPVSAAWALSGTFIQNSAAIIVGISVNSGLVPQSRPTYPRVVVEAAFGSLPGDSSAAIMDDDWTDLSAFCIGKQGQIAITTTRGQQYELSSPEAGQLTIACNNQAGDFDPFWAGSEFYSNAINSDMSMQVAGTTGWFANVSSPNVGFQMSPDFVFASAAGAFANESLKVLPDTGAATNSARYLFANNINPNGSYTATIWVYFPAGSPGSVVWSLVTQNALGFFITASQTYASVPAGVWTRLTVTGAPGLVEDGTSLWGFIDVHGSPTQPWYQAEVSAVPGTVPVLTGLLRLGVPVKVSAFWNGRRYPVGYGYVERWPQDWPDYPQWGWSNLIATDVVGVANSVNLPSAVQGEILADSPYFCFPFNEQYTANSSSSSASGGSSTASFSGVDGMFAINTSPINSRAATYIDGNVSPVVTGQTVGLLGDSGTGMGNSNDTTPSTGLANGPGAVYGPDLNMVNDFYFTEFWFTTPNVSAPLSFQANIKLLDIVVQQDLTNHDIGNGILFTIGVEYGGWGTYGFIWAATNASPTSTVLAQLGPNLIDVNGATFTVPSTLISVFVDSGNVFIWINGVEWGAMAYTPPLSGPIAMVFGQACYTTGTIYNTYAYSMAYGTMFPSGAPQFRITSRAQAGISGFINDGVTDRALRYMAWSGLNLGLAGAQDTASSLGPAYSVGGSTLAAALNADCSSFGGRWAGTANGNLVMLSRQAQYNQSTPTVFGDAPVGVLNQNPGFERGLQGWTALGCSATTVPVPGGSFSGSLVCQLAFGGSNSSPTLSAAPIAVTPGTWYELTAWSQSPSANYWNGGISLCVTWFNGVTQISTQALTAYPDLNAWSPAVLTVQAPVGATTGKFFVQVNGTPPPGPVILIDQAAVRLAFDQVPYQPSQSFDFDNTYVNNVVQSSVTEGPITTASPTAQDTTSIKKYFRRGPRSQNINGTNAGSAYDQVNWNLQQYKDPSMRVRQIECRPSSSPNSFTRILQNDVSNPASVQRGPLNSTKYNIPVITQRVEHTIGAGTWTVQYQLSPYTQQAAVLQVDNPGFDNISSNSLAW